MARKKKMSKRFKIALVSTIIVIIVTVIVILFLATDSDGDGLSNFTELRHGTSMFNSDTDGDSLSDWAEINLHNTNPLVADSDNDGLADGLEINTYGTDPIKSDTDHDGLTDGSEINLGADPHNTDTDNDGLSDGLDQHPTTHEWKLMDSDSDGWSDYKEYYETGTDRFNSDTDNDGVIDSSDPHPMTHEWKLMDSDNDGWNDYKEYYETGTSRFNSDTDMDGAPDPYDAHPLSASRKITKDLEWDYGGLTWTWTVDVSYDLYIYESQLDRMSSWSDWPQYTLDPTVKSLALGIKEAADNHGYGYYETVDFTLAFVQSLPYTTDDVTTGADEYPRYPLETLVDGGGDCEDTSFLFAGILREMGYDCRLLILPGHMAVGVWGNENYSGSSYKVSNKNFYYCETTGEGWTMGELPSAFTGVQATLYEVGTPANLLIPPESPTPPDLVVTSISSTVSGESLTVSVIIKNQGGKTAGASSVWVYYTRAGSGYEWYLNYSIWNSIASGESKTFTLSTNDMYGSGALTSVKAIADELDFIEESDETNNEKVVYY